MVATDDLLDLSTEDFGDLVDQDLRGRLDEGTSAALRSPELIERYYYALVAMSKRVEATLGATRQEYYRDRLNVTNDDSKARELEQLYSSKRSSTLRFKGGLDQALADAKRLLQQHRGLQYEHLARRIAELEGAIRQHKLSLESDMNQVASDYDTELWRVLGA
jgi:hypothetical protein